MSQTLFLLVLILTTVFYLALMVTVIVIRLTIESREREELAITFVDWLMENCELIGDEENPQLLWRYSSEDYSIEGLMLIYKQYH